MPAPAVIEVLGSTSLHGAAGGTPAGLTRTVYWPGGPGKLLCSGVVAGGATLASDGVYTPEGAFLYSEISPAVNAALVFPPGYSTTVVVDFVAPESNLSFSIGGLVTGSDTCVYQSLKLVPTSP